MYLTTHHPSWQNGPTPSIIYLKKSTPNKTHYFPNNKQFNTTPEDDQQNGRKRLG